MRMQVMGVNFVFLGFSNWILKIFLRPGICLFFQFIHKYHLDSVLDQTDIICKTFSMILFDSLYISIFEVKFPYIRFMVNNVTFNNISVVLCPVYIYNFGFKFEIPYTF
jgi:hypothetical protein